MSKVVRNLSTKENQEFWTVVKAAAQEVSGWPDWKRAGINVATERSRISSDTNRSEHSSTSSDEDEDEDK
jgi:hypothetical protein